MNIREFIKDIYYVGVNDRTTTLFESLWTLPYGVSYNSYLIKDKKNVLIDTVESSYTNGYIDMISKITGGCKLDYLVVNHMEPDHSGAIPSIIEKFPDIKIIGNKQTISMIKGFYHIEEDQNFMEISDGYTLSLGEKSLIFKMTPMVHWPETMMTYCPERKVLFSGDAFGTFGALNGHITDENLDTTTYKDEMYRYYACIVGKYGKFVQKALASTSEFELDYICSTHGPVWHKELKEIVRIVDNLSSGKYEEGVTIVYGSMYGNTAEIAETIAMELASEGVKNIKVYNAATADMSKIISDAYRYKALIAGAPTYSMNLFPPMETFMQSMLTRDVKGKIFAAFGSYTWAPAALKKIKSFAESLGWNSVYDFEMKQAPDTDDTTKAKELARAIKSNLQN